LPDACELVIRVRVEDPLVAVIVMEVDALAVQLRETLCPTVTVVGLADNAMVGTVGGVWVDEVPVPQAERVKSKKNASEKLSPRK